MPNFASKVLAIFGKKHASNGNGVALQPMDAATANRPILSESAVAVERLDAESVDRRRLEELETQQALVSQTMAMAQYAMDGSLLQANDNFARIFVFLSSDAHSFSYLDFAVVGDRDFWLRLQQGESLTGIYERRGSSGRPVWTQSTFRPLHRADGNVRCIIEISTDVTQQSATLQQLQMAMQEIQRVAKLSVGGDLVTRIPTDGLSGEITALCNEVNSVLNARNVLVGRVKRLTVEVLSAAEEISKGNTTLSRLTESQAASLEETASSMEQMTSSVKSTASNAAQASNFAQAAYQQAEAGIRVVNSVVSAMAEINLSSKRVADIISVIDAIAFQTNLLALNAAVEAARAGEQGRGFAVVASEVRSLAGRSAAAAKEIKSLIQESVKKVADGSALADASGQALEDIMSAVNKVSGVVTMIAESSMEQSMGIEQVNKAVMQIDEATQQNAALVEETAAASQAIVDQVQELHTTVEKYKTDSDKPEPKRVSGAA